jgi:phosphate transport system substrate-binding protein
MANPGALPLTLLLLGLLAACRGDHDPGVPAPLRGTTSSFAALAYWRWFNQLAVRDDLTYDLTVTGSGESIRAFLGGQVAFSGTDVAPTTAEIRAARHGVLAFPVTGGAIAVAYNHPTCQLRLSRRQLVEVFLGRIGNFRELGCPDQPLTLLHRGDASGTTANLTATLAALRPAWKQGPGVGRLVAWPAGEAVQGTDGMARALLAKPGTLGYIEASYLRPPLKAALIESRSGAFVGPSPEAAAVALQEQRLDRMLLGHDPDPAHGYPLVTLHWMLVPRQGLGGRAVELRRSLRFILGQSGQDDAELLDYIPLPEGVRRRSIDQLSRLRP